MNIQLSTLASDISRAVRDALNEDVGSGDITAELIPADKTSKAIIVAREHCIVCGKSWVNETYHQLGGIEEIEWYVDDGDEVTENTTIVKFTGNSRTLLTGERTALNFLQLLCGTATLANRYKNTLGQSPIKLLDTRKTIPGLRNAQKYAVSVGGCHNHRIGLFDAYLIKENHILACGSISSAIAQARANHPQKPVEIEVENVEELKEALRADADVIMLDNFSKEQLQLLANIDKGATKYELSGNLTIDDIASIKEYNIDFISFGALTKHVRAIDLSFRII